MFFRSQGLQYFWYSESNIKMGPPERAKKQVYMQPPGSKHPALSKQQQPLLQLPPLPLAVGFFWHGMAYLNRFNLASIAICMPRAPTKGWRGWWFISCTTRVKLHQSENYAWTEPWHPRLQSIPTASKSDRSGIFPIADIGTRDVVFYRVWKRQKLMLDFFTKDNATSTRGTPPLVSRLFFSGLDFEAKFCSDGTMPRRSRICICIYNVHLECLEPSHTALLEHLWYTDIHELYWIMNYG